MHRIYILKTLIFAASKAAFINVHITYKNNIKFNYKKDSTDLTTMVFPTGSMDELKGELSGIKTMELMIYSENPPHQMTLSWSPDNSASNDDDDWLFPEIDITISSKGGVFTKENSDVPFPFNPGPDPSPSPEPVSPSPEPVSPSPEPVSPSPEPVSPSPEPVSPSPEPVSPSPEPVSPSYQPESATPEPYSPGPMPPSYQPESPTPEPYSPSYEPESPTANPETSTTTQTTSTDSSGQNHGKAWVAPVLGSIGGLIVVIVIAALAVVYIIGRRKQSEQSAISQANLLSQEV